MDLQEKTLLQEQTLLRNDEYLRNVVETFNLCPFARQCRQTGKLQRIVLTSADVAAELRATLLTLQQTTDDDFEVALVIAPLFVGDHAQFEAMLRRVEAQVGTDLAHIGAVGTCFAVAFHPQLPFGTAQPHQLVGLFRRSPDPTVQLVRRSLLDRVRKGHGEHRYVDVGEMSTAETILAAAATLAGRISLSERIALNNEQTWQHQGPQLQSAMLGFSQRRPSENI